MVKSPSCSFRGLRFYSRHPHGGSQLLTIPVPGGIQYCLLASWCTRHACRPNTHTWKQFRGNKRGVREEWKGVGCKGNRMHKRRCEETCSLNIRPNWAIKTKVRTFRDIYVKFWFVGPGKLDFKICSIIKSGMPICTWNVSQEFKAVFETSLVYRRNLDGRILSSLIEGFWIPLLLFFVADDDGGEVPLVAPF